VSIFRKTPDIGLASLRGWGVNISEDARHWIGLLKYNPSTIRYRYIEENALILIVIVYLLVGRLNNTNVSLVILFTGEY
jgi:hypothetical protein